MQLDMTINSKMSKSAEGLWSCLVCGYATKIKTNMKFHVESKHIQSDGFECQICHLFCQNRKALRNHIDRNHGKSKPKQYLPYTSY